MLPVLALALVLSWGGVEARTPAIDAAATEQALRIRVGERASSWTIAIDEGAIETEVRAHMKHDAGRELERSFELTGETVEERSRELAAALALVIEQHATDTSPPPQRDPEPPTLPDSGPPPPEGWIAVGGRTSVGRPADPEGGATLRAGATWGRRIVQPMIAIGSMHARRDALRVDGVRFGAGVGIGAPIPKSPVWIGGAVLPQAAWTLARGRGRAGGWTSVTEVGLLTQLRARGVLAALRIGVELAAPALVASDRDARLRFGTARFMLGLELGVLLPPRKRAGGIGAGRPRPVQSPGPCRLHSTSP